MADRRRPPPPPPQDKPTRSPRPSSSSNKQASVAKTGYLVLYNFISAILWATVLGRVLVIAGFASFPKVYLGVGAFAKWTQTLAVLEVVHALLGQFSCFLVCLFVCWLDLECVGLDLECVGLGCIDWIWIWIGSDCEGNKGRMGDEG